MTENRRVWTPSPEIAAAANVTALAAELGCSDFEALYRFSLDQPERYWDVVNAFCSIRWREPYEGLVDLSRGRPFARWFPGGKLNWTDTLLAEAEAEPDRVAIVAYSESGERRQVTYAELKRQVRQLAGGLRSAGLGRGDRIGLLMENGIAASVSFLAISFIGAIAVPLFSGFGSDAVEARLASCGATSLIASTGFERRGRFVSTRHTLEEVRGRLGGALRIILRVAEADPEGLWPDCLDWRTLAAAEPLADAETMASDDPFMIICTSGTTGKPKGTVHTHGGFPIKIAHDSALHFNVKRDSVYCWPADMGWIAGPLVLTSALTHGARLVCYDGAPDFPDWGRLPRLIEAERITHFGSAPTLIRGLAANTPVSTAADMASVEILITAGEAIAPEHFTWFQENIGPGNTPVINYTGGSEASGALLSSVVTKPIPSGMFNCATPGIEVDVVDGEGRSLTGQVGELAVRAPFVGMTQSFWEDDARYLETYWETVPGIWIHGDLAIRDAAGNYILVGRSDDTIKVAGKRIGPAEIEEIVVEIAGVSEAAAVGVADPVKGQVIVLFFTTGGGAGDPDLEATIRARVQERLGKPFAPRAVYRVEELPKTRSSKVMRRVIRSLLSGQPAGDLSALVNPEAVEKIRAVVAG